MNTGQERNRKEEPSTICADRQRARVMRIESVRLEDLADQVDNLSAPADEALWKILINRQT